MKDIQNAKQRKLREARLEVIARIYPRGYPIRKICELVKEELGLKKVPSTQTIHNDIQILLEEWRKERIDNIDLAIQRELIQIEFWSVELSEAWDKSKTDHKLKFSRQKGELVGTQKDGETSSELTPTMVEKGIKEVVEFGDPRYVSELGKLQERRIKLLGLNAPEKQEHSGTVKIEITPEDVRAFQEAFNRKY